MKQPKKPTRRIKEIIHSNDLNENNYMVVKESEFYLTLLDKRTNKIVRIDNHIKKKRYK